MTSKTAVSEEQAALVDADFRDIDRINKVFAPILEKRFSAFLGYNLYYDMDMANRAKKRALQIQWNREIGGTYNPEQEGLWIRLNIWGTSFNNIYQGLDQIFSRWNEKYARYETDPEWNPLYMKKDSPTTKIQGFEFTRTKHAIGIGISLEKIANSTNISVAVYFY